jgi:GNAT superfamily N-acetyltransferase
VHGHLQLKPTAPEHPDVLALYARYFDELRQRFGAYEPPPLAELRAEDAITLVAYEGDEAVACGTLRMLDDSTAEVKRMFVAPEARGRGHARRILAALEDAARERGRRRVVLDTAASLHEAAALYLNEGYVAIERYNDNPYAARWFEKRLSSDARR